MTGSKGNGEFCFPERPQGTLMSRGNTIHCLPREQSVSVLSYLPTQKQKKKCEEIVCLTPAGSQICCGFKKHDLITCESEVQVIVSLGS